MGRVLCRGHTADVRKRTYAFVGFSVKFSVRGIAVVMRTDSPLPSTGNSAGWIEPPGGTLFCRDGRS